MRSRHIHREGLMNRFWVFVSVLLGSLSISAYAADGTCEAASDRQEAGRRCKDQFPEEVRSGCRGQGLRSAGDREEARGGGEDSFLKKCVADAKPAGKSAKETCDSQAADKKLAGAAKDSFVKKCIADAG